MQVNCTLLTLLELAVDVTSVGLLVPCFQVLLHVGDIGVVLGAEPVDRGHNKFNYKLYTCIPVFYNSDENGYTKRSVLNMNF